MENLLQEIHTFFPELKEKLSIHDLKAPSSTCVRDFYCRVLIELGGDVDNVRKVQMAQLDAEGVDIIPELNLVTAIRFTFPFLKFQLDDLLSPEVKRNAQLMSHVMNFLHFCEARLAHNNDQVEEYEKTRFKEMEQVRESAELKDREATKLAGMARKLDSDEQTLKQLKEVIPKLEIEVQKLMDNINEKRKIYKELDEAYSTNENKAHNLMKQLEMISAECEEFRKLIVKNPDEEKKNYDRKRQERDHALKTKNEYQEKCKAHTADLEKLKKQCEELKKKIGPILDELPILKECRDLKDSLLKNEEEMEQIHKQKEALNSNLINLENKIQNEKKTFTTKFAALKEKENSLTTKLAEKELEYKVKNKELKLTEKKYQQDLEKIDNHIASIENEYSELLHAWNLFMEEFNAVKNQLSCVQ